MHYYILYFNLKITSNRSSITLFFFLIVQTLKKHNKRVFYNIYLINKSLYFSVYCNIVRNIDLVTIVNSIEIYAIQ